MKTRRMRMKMEMRTKIGVRTKIGMRTKIRKRTIMQMMRMKIMTTTIVIMRQRKRKTRRRQEEEWQEEEGEIETEDCNCVNDYGDYGSVKRNSISANSFQQTLSLLLLLTHLHALFQKTTHHIDGLYPSLSASLLGSDPPSFSLSSSSSLFCLRN